MGQTVITSGVTGPEAPQENQGQQDGDLLAGKFKSVDDLVSSYKVLESKLGQGKSEDPQDEQQPQDEQKQDAPAEDETPDPYGPVVSGAMQQAGLSADEVSDHYFKNGSLTDDHYAALEKAGFTRDLVDVYLAGVQSKAAEAAGVAEADIKAIQSHAHLEVAQRRIGRPVGLSAELERCATARQWRGQHGVARLREWPHLATQGRLACAPRGGRLLVGVDAHRQALDQLAVGLQACVGRAAELLANDGGIGAKAGFVEDDFRHGHQLR